MASVYTSHPTAPGSILGLSPKKLLLLVKYIDDSAQRKLDVKLDKVNRTHPGLASDKLVLQKRFVDLFFHSATRLST